MRLYFFMFASNSQICLTDKPLKVTVLLAYKEASNPACIFYQILPNTAANFLLILLKTIQIIIGSVMHVIAAIAYPVNKIRLAQSL